MTTVHGVHGPKHDVETYLVGIWLPNQVVFTQVRVTKAEAILGAEVLIGMDIIAMGDFSVTNFKGITKFSYRTPSMNHIDYVEEHKAQAILEARSGKKVPVGRGSNRPPKKKRRRN